MKRSRPALVVLVACLVIALAGSAVYLVIQRQGSDVVVVTSVGSRDLASIQAEIDAQTSSPPTPTRVRSRRAWLGTPIPVHVTIPAIDVSTTVLPVGLDENGATEIPSDITKVGWYDLGVAPGAGQGSAVLIGHRDGVVQGHGVFYDLGTMSRSATVSWC